MDNLRPGHVNEHYGKAALGPLSESSNHEPGLELVLFERLGEAMAESNSACRLYLEMTGNGTYFGTALRRHPVMASGPYDRPSISASSA
ncbi:MAG: hypothetical protein JRM77_05705 [Nitrososphaerota archaeon]|nr:hypothetical protein [Nitrososphaerota archaeon]